MIQSIVKFSQLENRLDAEYYKIEYVEASKLIWKKNPVNNVFKFFNYIKGFAFESVHYQKQGIGVYRVSDIYDGHDFSRVLKVPYSFWDKYKRFRLCPKDVIITVTGTVGLNTLLPEKIPQMLLNQNAMLLRAKSAISTEFLYAFFQTKYFQNLIFRSAHMGTRPFLGLEFFESITLPLITQKQNQIIKELLDLSYKKRDLAEQKYQEAQKLLNDYLQIDDRDFEFKKTFSLPFSQLEDRFDGEYYQTKSLGYIDLIKKRAKKVLKLGDVLENIKYGTSEKVSYQERGVPFLRVTDINKFYTIEIENGKFISKNKAQESSAYRVKKEDLIISRTGTLGSVVYVDDSLDGSVFGSYFIKVSPRKDKAILPLYIAIFLNSKIGKLQTEKTGSGGIQTNLTIDMIKNLVFPMIDIKCQQRLCDLYQGSVLLQKESKQLLEKAKKELESVIEKGDKNGQS